MLVIFPQTITRGHYMCVSVFDTDINVLCQAWRIQKRCTFLPKVRLIYDHFLLYYSFFGCCDLFSEATSSAENTRLSINSSSFSRNWSDWSQLVLMSQNQLSVCVIVFNHKCWKVFAWLLCTEVNTKIILDNTHSSLIWKKDSNIELVKELEFYGERAAMFDLSHLLLHFTCDHVCMTWEGWLWDFDQSKVGSWSTNDSSASEWDYVTVSLYFFSKELPIWRKHYNC